MALISFRQTGFIYCMQLFIGSRSSETMVASSRKSRHSAGNEQRLICSDTFIILFTICFFLVNPGVFKRSTLNLKKCEI